MKNIYVWFSNPTSVTGRNIIEGLTTRFEDTDNILISGGKEAPNSDVDLLISYGAGARTDTALPEIVFNNPANIRGNVNKVRALELMAGQGVKVANFKKVSTLTEEELDNFEYPVILRTNQHHGGRGLAVCLCKGQVKKLLENNINNFGHIMELKAFDNEYRLHVCNGEVIKAARKTIQSDPVAAWKTNYFEKIEKIFERREENLDPDIVNTCLDAVAADLTLPDLLVKSNKRGWCFKNVKLENVDESLKENAIKAVKTVGLDFGAVDCAIDFDGNAYVIEVNTGPGLQGSTLDVYLDSFTKYIKSKMAPEVVEDTYTDSSEVSDVVRAYLEVGSSDVQTEMSAILEGIQQLNTRMLELQARI